MQALHLSSQATALGKRYPGLNPMTIETDAPSVKVRWFTTLSGVYEDYSQIALSVNGAHHATLAPSGAGVALESTVELPGGTKRVDVVAGPESNVATGPRDAYGSWVKSIGIPGGSRARVLAPSQSIARVVVVGDSVAACFNALAPAEAGWVIDARARLPASLVVDAYGGRRMADLDPAEMSAAYARLGRVDVVAVQLGTNDWGFGADPADTGHSAALFADGMHATIGCRVVFYSPIVRLGEGGGPFPLSAHRAEIQAVAAARAFCGFVDWSGLLTLDQLDDGTHPAGGAPQGILADSFVATVLTA